MKHKTKIKLHKVTVKKALSDSLVCKSRRFPILHCFFIVCLATLSAIELH